MRVALALLLASSLSAQQPALTLTRELPLSSFDGRIDHMALDEVHHRLFLTGIRANQVLVLDLSNGREVHRISGLSEPQGVLYLPESNHLFVTNGGTGAVNVYDASTFTLLHTTTLGDDADNIRFEAATHAIFVGFGGLESAGIAMLNEQGELTGTIPLPAHPESFQLDPSRHRIFINIPNAKRIVVADLSTRKAIAQFPAHGNFPMALSADGRVLITGERHPGQLMEYDADTGKILAHLPLADDCDDLYLDSQSQTGRHTASQAHTIYATSGSGSINVFRISADHRIEAAGTLPTVPGARTSLLAPTLHTLFVAAPQSSSQAARILVFQIP